MSDIIDTRPVENILMQEGLISESRMNWARMRHSQTNTPLLELLLAEKIVSETDLARAWSIKTGIPFVDPENCPVNAEALNKVPRELLTRHEAWPVSVEPGELTLAFAKPPPSFVVDEFTQITGLRINCVLGLKSEITKNLDSLNNQGKDGDSNKSKSVQASAWLLNNADSTSDGQIVKMMNRILERAIEEKASDIHLETVETHGRIRLRVDGSMAQIAEVPASTMDALISRVRIMAELDITEHHLPQDGRFKQNIKGNTVDFRVSILPGLTGPSVTLRILNSRIIRLDISRLGFNAQDQEKVEYEIFKTHGMTLVIGPTGSGKTTTLYSMLAAMGGDYEKYITIEDPVELVIPGITQMQVRLNREDDSRNLTFARGLRSALRADPDVILVGEIRDTETGMIAVNAALTGHIVLSTIHANSAVAFGRRLEHLGLQATSYIEAINLVICQRLVRLLCRKCRISGLITEAESNHPILSGYFKTGDKVWRAEGCPHCGGKGYQGRTGVFEIMPMSDSLRKMYCEGALQHEILAMARQEGMTTIMDNCVKKIVQGLCDPGSLRSLIVRDTGPQ